MRALILLVEEDRQTRRTICDMLEAMEYRALGVGSYERARRLMSGIGFDTLIVTARTPVGIELTYAAEAMTLQSGIKVVLFSTGALPQHRSSLVDAFVAKPFLLESLGEALIAVLRKLH
jgi:DNA-binding response OmpR family regulator